MITIKSTVASAGEHIGKVIQMLHDGVAFPNVQNNRLLEYQVISHEGDELGIITTADLNFAIHFMKRNGWPVGKYVDGYQMSTLKTAFTFGWQGWFHQLTK